MSYCCDSKVYVLNWQNKKVKKSICYSTNVYVLNWKNKNLNDASVTNLI